MNSRCLELIYQADGTLEEKLACAQLGYYGNIPRATAYYPQVILPESLPGVYERRSETELRGNGMLRRCNTGCSCGGNTGGGPGGSGGSSIYPGLANSTPGRGLNSNVAGISFKAELPWLLIAVLVGVVIAKKRK